MFSIIRTQTVVFARGFGGRFQPEKHNGWQAQTARHPTRREARQVCRRRRPLPYCRRTNIEELELSVLVQGKERWHGLGSFKDVSLKEARLARDAARLQVRAGVDPVHALAIAEIKPSHIHDLLKPIWVEKWETANRVRGRIETIIAKNVDVDDTDFAIPQSSPSSFAKSFRGA